MYNIQLTGKAVSLVVVIGWNKDNLGPVLGKGTVLFSTAAKRRENDASDIELAIDKK